MLFYFIFQEESYAFIYSNISLFIKKIYVQTVYYLSLKIKLFKKQNYFHSFDQIGELKLLFGVSS